MSKEYVTPEHAPFERASGETLFRTYAAELPRWLCRFHVPARFLDDASQDFWIAALEQAAKLPASDQEARLALLKLASTVARRWSRRDANDANPNDPTTDLESFSSFRDGEAQIFDALAVIEVLDLLEEPHRGLLIAHKVLGYTAAELANELGISEDKVARQIWTATAGVATKLRKPNKAEEKRRALAALLLPGPLALTPELRAGMCAIWSAEGRLPQFGGPKGPPPPPPPFFPVSKLGALPLSLPALTPKLVALAVLVSLPLLGGLALVLALLTRPRERPPLARSGLYTPAATLAIVCIAEPPSTESTPQKPTSSDTSTTPKPHAEPLDTLALEALGRTAFSPGKGRK